MKTTILTIAIWLTAAVGMAQTLNVTTGSVTDAYPAGQTGVMNFTGGETLTILEKTYSLGEITKMYTDATDVTDNTVNVVYSGSEAAVYVAGNVARYVTATVSGAHVSVVQSADVDATVGEITYNLSGTSTDGEFYMEGSYKATVELNGLTLTNVTPVYSGAAVHIQNGKRIKVKVVTGTTNTLVDAASGSQKGCLYVKGHAEFAQKGTLNVTGNVKHGIKAGEYISLKNATVNVLSAVGDGISCNEYFLMESGTVSISGTGDDGIQCDIDNSEGVSTGETTDHEDEDSGNIYLQGGTVNISVTADAAKGIKSEGDFNISGGTVTVSTSGNGVWDSTKLKTKAASCLGADGNMTISGGTLTLTSTGAGGKGINVDGTLTVTDGDITVKTSGKVVAYVNGTLYNNYTLKQADRISNSDYKSSPKGMKVDGGISISGGNINVTAYHEAIESKGTLEISGGSVYCQSEDDAINSSGNMTISGGYVMAYSTGNDGLDANGNLYIKGGLVYAIGTTDPEKSIDANTEGGYKLYIQGGTIIAIGDLENGSQLTQSCWKLGTSSSGGGGGHGPGGGGPGGSGSQSWTANTWYAMTVGSETIAFKTPASGGSALILSAASQPTLTQGVTVSGGTPYFNDLLYTGATVSGGSSATLSSYTSSSGGGGGWGW